MRYTEFDQEVAEKKAIASGARHRKIGSKSRKCTLPGDYLTQTQKCKLNGEVITMNLHKPMDFKDFTKMSTESQREYMLHLKNELKGTKTNIQEMFGISRRVMDEVCKALRITDWPKGGKKNPGEIALWHDFLTGTLPAKSTPDFTPPPALYRSVQMKSGQLTFSGDLQEICCELQAILGQNVMMDTMEVSFTIAEGVSK